MITLRHRVSLAAGAAFAVVLALAPAVHAGVNTWSGAPSSGPPIEGTRTLMATDPRDPYVVYAVFQPSLYKSRDGGRTWTHLATFVLIESLLVHPTAPDTLYLGVVDGPDFEFAGVVKSSDAGTTWERKPFFPTFLNFAPATALVGSTTDADTVYAGASTTFWRTTDGGDTWTQQFNLTGVIASLVLSPSDEHTVYAGTESDFYYFPFGAFSRSSDSGSTWTQTELGTLDSVGAIVIDPDASSTLYVGLSANRPTSERGIRRSDDGGVTFSRADGGMHLGANVFSLAIDPADPSTLYAGTDAGVYRSRDSGSTWSSMGQMLWGQPVGSLAISSDGRHIHAGVQWGAFDLDLVSGPADVAASTAGGARVLRWSSDRLVVQTVDGSDNWTTTPPSNASATWTAVAIASAPNGEATVLWQNGDGRSALETVGVSGGGASVVLPGTSRGLPTDVAVGADGQARLLWTTPVGGMHIATVGADGHVTRGPQYGATPGWMPLAIDVASDGSTWVLWRSVDGRGAASRQVDGAIVTTVKWGATAGWTAEDIAVSSDGGIRILARTASGSMQVWKLGEDGSRSVGVTYENPDFVPRRIAGGSDGLTRVLWGGGHGEGDVWFVDSAGNHVSVGVPVLP